MAGAQVDDRAAVGATAGARLARWCCVDHRRDLLALLFLTLLAALYLSPALTSGLSFGPSDLGRGLSVLTRAPHQLTHNVINGDIIDQSVAWNTLNYTLIHHGQFPLWNVYAGNGLPQFLNFESAVLALPSLVGYLFPLSLSFTVTIAMKLLIAGYGTLWCLRLLRLRVVPATLGALTFMLSGAFSNWLGWSISGVICWMGFLLAGIILCYRTETRRLGVVVLAPSVAFCIFGGFPEGYILVALTLLLLLALIALSLLMTRRGLDLRGIVATMIAALLGLALSSPLWFPGLTLVRQSIRANTDAVAGIPIHGILLALAQGYDGLPTAGSSFFLGRTNYFESAAYLGVIALVLAILATLVHLRGRGRTAAVVRALALTSIAELLVIYQFGSHDPIQRLVRDVGLGAIATHRLLPVLAFTVALLVAYGLDWLIGSLRRGSLDRALLAGVALVGVVLALMWVTPSQGVGSCVPNSVDFGASPSCIAIRRASLVGPSAVWFVLLLVAVGAPVLSRRVHATRTTPIIVALLVLTQAGTLLFAGATINTFSRTNYPATTAVTTLGRITDGALVAQDGGNATCPVAATVACGLRAPTGIDLYPNINVGYGIDELGLHDPIIPKATFADWPIPNAGQLQPGTNLFNPDVNSLALARAYGVAYLLVPAGVTPPAGLVRITSLINDGITIALYRVPGAALVSSTAGAVVAKITRVGDAHLTIKLVGRGATTLVAHLTDVPGWHLSLPGATLHRGPTNDLVIQVPASALRSGGATLTISYLPRDLLLGGIAALLALVVVLALVVQMLLLLRKSRNSSPEGAS